MNWYLDALKKYATFGGRARRKEYWFFSLFNFLIGLLLAFVDVANGTFNEEVGMGLVGGIYALAVLLPCIAVSVRRLHDTEHSGWWLLIGLIPVVGWIVLLIFMVREGTRGPNRFGEDPKQAAA
jgi:uncharacterized membrane protein YhaH (DUF805 family)